jgi:orotate phosphoribosyltransferase
MNDLRREVVSLVRDRGYQRREAPFKLASGLLSSDFVDGKAAIATGRGLSLVSAAVIDVVRRFEVEFTAVGGLTMGADSIAHGVAIMADSAWFSVRKTLKAHGRQQWIEGTQLDSSSQALLVDDVVTSGGSIVAAYDHVLATGAEVVAAVVLVDRSDVTSRLFAERQVPYEALVTYKDLGIEAVDAPLRPFMQDK